MHSPHGERARQAHEESERWGRTWDPSGARRPRGLAGTGMTGSVGALVLLLVVAALVAWWLS